MKEEHMKNKNGLEKMFLKWNDFLVGSRLSLKDQTHFIKRFAFLIKAGIPVVECLHILREQAKSKSHARVLEKIIDDIANGRTLSKSFAKFPHLFNDFAIYIIKVGESTGMLNENLSYLADELKKKHALKRKVVGAFIYPAVITAATLGITIFLMVYLFPKLIPVFTSLHVQLPLPTRIIIASSAFLSKWWLWCLLGFILVVVLFVAALRQNARFHFLFDRACLKLPIIGTVIRYYNVANSSRTLGLVLKSGVPFSEALPITAETAANLVYKKEWNDLTAVAIRGEEISTRLRARQMYFPDIFAHLITVGEKSGTLSDTFAYLSEMYDNEVDDFTKNLSTLIEPVLMIFMGVLVGFVAISIIAPIYSITQNLHA
jgi:type IV pilus assembly protein PilC